MKTPEEPGKESDKNYLNRLDADGPLATGYPWGREENLPQPSSYQFDFDTTIVCRA